jgi:drug/metabolite transporter (DMT)-like permease
VTNDKGYFKGALLVVAATICFAFQPVFGHLAYTDGANAVGLLWLRFLLAAILLQLFTWRAGTQDWLSPLLIGAVLSIGALCYFFALSQISVGLATMLFFLFPIYIFLFSVLRRQESVSLVKFNAIMFAMGGIYISVDTNSSLPLWGVVCGLIAGACYGAYIMLSSHFLVHRKPFNSLSWVTTGGMICLSVPTLAGQAELPNSYVGYGAAFGLCLVSTLLSFSLLLAGTRLMGRATDVAILTTTEIGSTLFLAWLLLNETVTTEEIIGAGLVFIAAVIILVSRQREVRLALTE